LELEPKAQGIFERIKPFSPQTAYDKRLISAEERDYFVNFLAQRSWLKNNSATSVVPIQSTPIVECSPKVEPENGQKS
jgi:hypothetical protein